MDEALSARLKRGPCFWHLFRSGSETALDLMCGEKLEILVIVKSGMSPHHSVDFRNEVRRLVRKAFCLGIGVSLQGPLWL